MGFCKKALFISAFFVFWGSGFARGERCPAQGGLQQTQWQKVLDGDTLLLRNGSKLRVLGINTPELGRNGKPNESGAVEARRAVEQLLLPYPDIQLRPGNPDRDRYGRILAEVYLPDGRNLGAVLVARGLAYHVVVPPNDNHWQCLASLEESARKRKMGVWQSAKPVYEVVSSGFQLVRSKVSKVASSRRYLWLDLEGGVVLRVAHKDLQRFAGLPGERSAGDVLEVRGWVVDRRSHGAKLKSEHLRWMLPLRHPSMVRVIKLSSTAE